MGYMRNAYALLGLSFIIVFIGAYVLIERAYAPTTDDVVPAQDTSSNQEIAMMTLSASAFEDGGQIPSKFTCDADNVSPELSIENAPEGTESFVLVMDDPDIPDSVKERLGAEKFDHWVLYNIPGDTRTIPEGNAPGTHGLTSRGEAAYAGPCPPDAEHRYIFRLYALSGQLNFIKAPTLDEVEAAAQGSALESASLTGRYERVNE